MELSVGVKTVIELRQNNENEQMVSLWNGINSL